MRHILDRRVSIATSSRAFFRRQDCALQRIPLLIVHPLDISVAIPQRHFQRLLAIEGLEANDVIDNRIAGVWLGPIETRAGCSIAKGGSKSKYDDAERHCQAEEFISHITPAKRGKRHWERHGGAVSIHTSGELLETDVIVLSPCHFSASLLDA